MNFKSHFMSLIQDDNSAISLEQKHVFLDLKMSGEMRVSGGPGRERLLSAVMSADPVMVILHMIRYEKNSEGLMISRQV